MICYCYRNLDKTFIYLLHLGCIKERTLQTRIFLVVTHNFLSKYVCNTLFEVYRRSLRLYWWIHINRKGKEKKTRKKIHFWNNRENYVQQLLFSAPLDIWRIRGKMCTCCIKLLWVLNGLSVAFSVWGYYHVIIEWFWKKIITLLETS